MKYGEGLSICLSFGKYAGFRTQFNNEEWRIVLGWAAISLCFFDMDVVFGLLSENYRDYKHAAESDIEL